MVVYIVMRDEGIRTDGHYYESKTLILGVRETAKEASELLDYFAKSIYPNESPVRGSFNKNGNTELVYGDFELEDRFWIQAESTKEHPSWKLNDILKEKGGENK